MMKKISDLAPQYNYLVGADMRNKSSRGSARPTSKLNEREVLLIRQTYWHGEKDIDTGLGALAKEYGVSNVTIWKIVRGLSWRHVGGPIF